MPEMKTIVFGKRSRARLLHIETDGCIVNIVRGLHDKDGREVTSVEIICDQSHGELPWTLPDLHDSKGMNVRVVRALESDAIKIDDSGALVCPHCKTADVPRLVEYGMEVRHDLTEIKVEGGILKIEAHGWGGTSSDVSDEGDGYALMCVNCLELTELPKSAEIEWL